MALGWVGEVTRGPSVRPLLTREGDKLKLSGGGELATAGDDDDDDDEAVDATRAVGRMGGRTE